MVHNPYAAPRAEVSDFGAADPQLATRIQRLGNTVIEPFAERFPDRFFNVGVAEQNMVGIATGLAEAGFFSRDGKRIWWADRRPGQTIPTAEWRQDDPGVMPAGDIYGAGAPTGIAFYEGDAFGPKWRGMLLSAEAAKRKRYEFLITAAPIAVPGGTGSPLNPIATF